MFFKCYPHGYTHKNSSSSLLPYRPVSLVPLEYPEHIIPGSFVSCHFNLHFFRAYVCYFSWIIFSRVFLWCQAMYFFSSSFDKYLLHRCTQTTLEALLTATAICCLTTKDLTNRCCSMVTCICERGGSWKLCNLIQELMYILCLNHLVWKI